MPVWQSWQPSSHEGRQIRMGLLAYRGSVFTSPNAGALSWAQTPTVCGLATDSPSHYPRANQRCQPLLKCFFGGLGVSEHRPIASFLWNNMTNSNGGCWRMHKTRSDVAAFLLSGFPTTPTAAIKACMQTTPTVNSICGGDRLIRCISSPLSSLRK